MQNIFPHEFVIYYGFYSKTQKLKTLIYVVMLLTKPGWNTQLQLSDKRILFVEVWRMSIMNRRDTWVSSYNGQSLLHLFY